jgi:hypothetical protein
MTKCHKGNRYVPTATRWEVLRRDGFRCVYCGVMAWDTELDVDHVRPVSAGGNNAVNNLVAACKDCNLGKGNRVLDVLPDGLQERIDRDLERRQLIRAARMGAILYPEYTSDMKWFDSVMIMAEKMSDFEAHRYARLAKRMSETSGETPLVSMMSLFDERILNCPVGDEDEGDTDE